MKLARNLIEPKVGVDICEGAFISRNKGTLRRVQKSNNLLGVGLESGRWTDVWNGMTCSHYVWMRERYRCGMKMNRSLSCHQDPQEVPIEAPRASLRPEIVAEAESAGGAATLGIAC